MLVALRPWRVSLISAATVLLVSCRPSPRLAPGTTRTASTDGMVQAYVPAGLFQMGSTESDPEADRDEFPAHEVYLDAFWMDTTEITSDQFAQYVASGGCTPPQHSFRYGDPTYRDHPVLGVAHPQAAAYCVWAGRRLPTEAEWEKAARGEGGRRYPWGDEPPDETRANFSGIRNDTAPVGSFPAGASSYGIFDLAWNVWVWASGSATTPDHRGATRPDTNRPNCASFAAAVGRPRRAPCAPPTASGSSHTATTPTAFNAPMSRGP